MIVERDVDCGALYAQVRHSVSDAVRERDATELARIVPATPAWTVQDVVAHVTGIAVDLSAGRFPDEDAEAWTATQVESRRGHTIDEVLAEWTAASPAFEDGLRLFGYETGSHFVGDLWQHRADLHHALELRRCDDDPALPVALDFYLDSFHQTLVEQAAGTVVAEVDGVRWELGAGPVVATITTTGFEALRALAGRRSADQLRRLDWSGDPEPVLALVSRYGTPGADLLEA